MSRSLFDAIIRISLPDARPGHVPNPDGDYIGWVDIADDGRGLVEMYVVDPMASGYPEGHRVLVERDIAEAGEFIRRPRAEANP